MVLETISTWVALILAVVAGVYLLTLMRKVTEGLKKGSMLLGIGILAFAVVPLAEVLRSNETLAMGTFHTTMNIAILVGSVLLAFGAYILHKTISGVAK